MGRTSVIVRSEVSDLKIFTNLTLKRVWQICNRYIRYFLFGEAQNALTP